MFVLLGGNKDNQKGQIEWKDKKEPEGVKT